MDQKELHGLRARTWEAQGAIRSITIAFCDVISKRGKIYVGLQKIHSINFCIQSVRGNFTVLNFAFVLWALQETSPKSSSGPNPPHTGHTSCALWANFDRAWLIYEVFLNCFALRGSILTPFWPHLEPISDPFGPWGDPLGPVRDIGAHEPGGTGATGVLNGL